MKNYPILNGPGKGTYALSFKIVSHFGKYCYFIA